MTSPSPDPTFWRGRRVLVTGHTGFKGGWLALWLARLGAEATGIALAPEPGTSLFESALIANHIDSRIVDIRDADAIKAILRDVRPEVVFHLAAQPLVRESYRRPVETFATNMMGTVHVLEALRGIDETRVALMITTDKVYANREWVYPYREDDPLGGHDPYAASKAACEIAIASYRLSFLAERGTAVASARAGNVIGGGDWSSERLIPDAVRAWAKDEPLVVRRPEAVRPWQHVLEPLNAYLVLAQRLWSDPSLAQAYNIGPPPGEQASVRTVVTLAREAFGRGETTFGAATTGPHESGLLALETAKARHLLAITPRWNLADAVSRTMDWYRAFGEGTHAYDLCDADLTAYEGAA